VYLLLLLLLLLRIQLERPCPQALVVHLLEAVSSQSLLVYAHAVVDVRGCAEAAPHPATATEHIPSATVVHVHIRGKGWLESATTCGALVELRRVTLHTHTHTHTYTHTHE
jgi:hypothetical protein